MVNRSKWSSTRAECNLRSNSSPTEFPREIVDRTVVSTKLEYQSRRQHRRCVFLRRRLNDGTKEKEEGNTGRKYWRTAGFLAHSVRSSAHRGEKGREFSVAHSVSRCSDFMVPGQKTEKVLTRRRQWRERGDKLKWAREAGGTISVLRSKLCMPGKFSVPCAP
ncbi:hypothetical protein K0M31_019219 [Melipona bicolor]|uniref:Uncharacterized protein n=1 Tax=Melipona bicolor TaxID=60889 RepID=A0AA40KQX0_9HYME|nr:hypothetical protein K0M31_019219 [Melipona bicolor]